MFGNPLGLVNRIQDAGKQVGQHVEAGIKQGELTELGKDQARDAGAVRAESRRLSRTRELRARRLLFVLDAVGAAAFVVELRGADSCVFARPARGLHAGPADPRRPRPGPSPLKQRPISRARAWCTAGVVHCWQRERCLCHAAR